MKLTMHEECQDKQAQNNRTNNQGRKSNGAHHTEAVQQRTQTQRRRDYGKLVHAAFALALAAIAIFERNQARDDARRGKTRNNIEQNMPVKRVDDKTGKCRASSRSNSVDQAEYTHRLSAMLHGKRCHELGQAHGHEHARAHRLQHTANQQQLERRAPRGEKRSRKEGDHGAGEQRARAVVVNKVRHNRHHDGVHDGETVHEPLHCCRIDGKLYHDGGKRRGDKRLVEQRDKRTAGQHSKADEVFTR